MDAGTNLFQPPLLSLSAYIFPISPIPMIPIAMVDFSSAMLVDGEVLVLISRSRARGSEAGRELVERQGKKERGRVL